MLPPTKITEFEKNGTNANANQIERIAVYFMSFSFGLMSKNSPFQGVNKNQIKIS